MIHSQYRASACRAAFKGLQVNFLFFNVVTVDATGPSAEEQRDLQAPCTVVIGSGSKAVL